MSFSKYGIMFTVKKKLSQHDLFRKKAQAIELILLILIFDTPALSGFQIDC